MFEDTFGAMGFSTGSTQGCQISQKTLPRRHTMTSYNFDWIARKLFELFKFQIH